jgi:hypothetical protein
MPFVALLHYDQGMKRVFFCRIAQIVHLAALAVWLGSVAMSGVVAAIVFPLMRTLEPTLAAYPEYEGDHALLAAGRIASKVFFTVDMVQFVCGSLALATLLIMIMSGYSLNTMARVLRMIVLFATLALLSYHIFFFMDGLQKTLQGYWHFAAEGNTMQADQFKELFLESHSAASRILGAMALLVLINIGLAGWTLTATNSGSTSAKRKNNVNKNKKAKQS